MKNKALKRTISFLVSVLMLLNTSLLVLGAEKIVDAKMYWSDDLTSWNDTESSGAIFDISDFEPGMEEIKYIKIENAGDLAFSYALDFVSEQDTSLADAIDVYVSDAINGTKTIADMTSIGTLKDVINGNSVSTGKILPNDLTGDDFYTNETVIAIALKMKDNASVDYMDKTIADFEIQLTATECEYDGYPSVDKFAVVFPNTSDYLYRVGNQNTVKLGSLFKALEGADIGNVTATIESLDANTNVSGTFTAKSDWTASTIQFTGTGPVKVTIDDDDFANALSINLEVINAKNVTSYSELTNANSVLLNDITMISNGSFYLSNATLYGNGFTFDVSNGAYNSSGYLSSNYLVSLTNANLDNVKITGAVYTQYGATRDVDYNRSTVYSSGSNTISNSYISNCAAPVRVNGGNIEIINSTLKGGNFANLDIRNGHVTLDNVTTINQVDSNDTADDGTVVVGLGVVVYYENVLETTTVDIVNGITQHNHLSKAQADAYINDTASPFTNAMFNSSYSSLQYSDGNDTWVNTGILSMTSSVGDGNISDVDGYIEASPSMSVPMTGTVTGYVHTKVPDATSIKTVAPEYNTAGQYAIAPSYKFDYTEKNYVAKTDGSNDYCYEDSGTVLISMDEGDTFNWDTSILTATKNGQTLGYTVSMNGTDYTRKAIPFTKSGNYTVTYTYTDANNYDVDENGDITTYSKTYTKNVYISVSAIKPDAKNAEFTFGSSNQPTEKITVGNNTYISAKGVSHDNSKWSYITVDGQKIYYPIVEATITSSTQAYFNVFKDVVTITDYADAGTGDPITYNSSTTTMPSGLTVVKGRYGEFADFSSNWSTLKDTDLTSVGAENVFKYAASSAASSTPTTYNSALCYASPSGLKARVEYITIAQYSYTDATNTTYYYYVGYHMADQTSSGGGCFAEGTLITLANGSQKAIEDLTFEDELLVWDFFKGEYTTSTPSLLLYDGTEDWNIITLNFNDGTQVRTIYEHGFFDVEENDYVYINAENVNEYIGHKFIKTNGKTENIVELISYEITNEHTGCYTLLTSQHNNCIANGVLTVTPPPIEHFYDYFEIGEDMKYINMEEDIEKYGLYTYDDFSDYISYDEFIAFNGAYLKILVEKGYFTFKDILEQISYFGVGEEEKIPTYEPETTPATIEEDEITEEPAIMLLSAENVKSDTITSSSNTIKTASYGIESAIENNVVTLTATGTASTGYAKITVDGESFYTVQIPQGESIKVSLKNTENAKDLTVTCEAFWGNSANYEISQEGLLANDSEIDFGTFTMTVSGSTVVLSNTTKYPVTGDVYLAVYEGKNLVSVKKQSVTVEGKDDLTYAPEITVPENALVKAFIWETGSMTPIL